MSGINNYFSNNNIFNGTEIPTQGKFDVGDIIVNIGENAEEEPMWMCIEAGEPGVWKVVGKVEEIDLSGYQEKTDENLVTESKDLVGAINELFQSANNGKELIASAIGEPLNAEDTFSAMSDKINELNMLFKEKLIEVGITDSLEGLNFKQLIFLLDKVKLENPCLGVTLNSNVYSFNNINETYQLEATVTPIDTTDTLSWISTNENVAIVNDTGLVSSIGAGTCEIIATCGSFVGVCSITVIIACTDITLNKSSYTYSGPVNSTYQLVATVTPTNTTDTINWSSSNTNVFTVSDNGICTLKTNGNANITATCGTKSATCALTGNVTIPCTNVRFKTYTTITYTYYENDTNGYNNETLYISVTPTNTTDTVTLYRKPSCISNVVVSQTSVSFVKTGTGSGTLSVKCGDQYGDITINVKAES